MKSMIVTTLIGIFALNAKGKVVGVELFPASPKEAASRLTQLQNGQIGNELTQLLKTLQQKGYDNFSFEESALASSVEKNLGLVCNVAEGSRAAMSLRKRLGETAVELRIFEDLKTFREYVHNVTVAMAEKAVTRETQRRDIYAIQVIRTLDDLDRTLNLFSGRIREWYGLHFPELDKLLDKHETYMRLVSNLGARENFTVKKLESEGVPSDKAQAIAAKAKASIGFDVNPKDLVLLQRLSNETLQLHNCRTQAEEYLAALMEEVAPNMTSILGPLLSARLMSIAGSLTNLAKMPASTIQVLGAEKALFRSLKTGSRPPKHGVIFQYQHIHAAPKWQRGKIARALSGKLSIAARIDAFGGEFIGEMLRNRLERKIREIQDKYASPPSVKRKNERPRGSGA